MHRDRITVLVYKTVRHTPIAFQSISHFPLLISTSNSLLLLPPTNIFRHHGRSLGPFILNILPFLLLITSNTSVAPNKNLPPPGRSLGPFISNFLPAAAKNNASLLVKKSSVTADARSKKKGTPLLIFFEAAHYGSVVSAKFSPSI
jgi:hypothetical protein